MSRKEALAWFRVLGIANYSQTLLCYQPPERSSITLVRVRHRKLVWRLADVLRIEHDKLIYFRHRANRRFRIMVALPWDRSRNSAKYTEAIARAWERQGYDRDDLQFPEPGEPWPIPGIGEWPSASHNGIRATMRAITAQRCPLTARVGHHSRLRLPAKHGKHRRYDAQLSENTTPPSTQFAGASARKQNGLSKTRGIIDLAPPWQMPKLVPSETSVVALRAELLRLAEYLDRVRAESCGVMAFSHADLIKCAGIKESARINGRRATSILGDCAQWFGWYRVVPAFTDRMRARRIRLGSRPFVIPATIPAEPLSLDCSAAELERQTQDHVLQSERVISVVSGSAYKLKELPIIHSSHDAAELEITPSEPDHGRVAMLGIFSPARSDRGDFDPLLGGSQERATLRQDGREQASVSTCQPERERPPAAKPAPVMIQEREPDHVPRMPRLLDRSMPPIKAWTCASSDDLPRVSAELLEWLQPWMPAEVRAMSRNDARVVFLALRQGEDVTLERVVSAALLTARTGQATVKRQELAAIVWHEATHPAEPDYSDIWHDEELMAELEAMGDPEPCPWNIR